MTNSNRKQGAEGAAQGHGPKPQTPVEKALRGFTPATRAALEARYPRTPNHPGIYFLDLPLGEQMFTYMHPAGYQLDIAASSLGLWAEKNADRIQIDIKKEHADLIIQWRGIEEHRVKRLNQQWGHKPILIIETEDKMHIFVDGNHRYIWLYRNGYNTANCYLVRHPDWLRFTVHGFPTLTEAELMSSHSGIQ